MTEKNIKRKSTGNTPSWNSNWALYFYKTAQHSRNACISILHDIGLTEIREWIDKNNYN